MNPTLPTVLFWIFAAIGIVAIIYTLARRERENRAERRRQAEVLQQRINAARSPRRHGTASVTTLHPQRKSAEPAMQHTTYVDPSYAPPYHPLDVMARDTVEESYHHSDYGSSSSSDSGSGGGSD